MAHSIGHALGTLHHVPHGAAVAIGLEAALGWEVDGAGDVFAPAAEAFGVTVDEVPERYRRLWGDSHLAAAVAALPDAPLDPGPIADLMVAEENRPMYENSCRRADDAQRAELAERTVAVWHSLRSVDPR
jgi:alcohol dehydrogenase class IV